MHYTEPEWGDCSLGLTVPSTSLCARSCSLWLRYPGVSRESGLNRFVRPDLLSGTQHHFSGPWGSRFGLRNPPATLSWHVFASSQQGPSPQPSKSQSSILSLGPTVILLLCQSQPPHSLKLLSLCGTRPAWREPGRSTETPKIPLKQPPWVGIAF